MKALLWKSYGPPESLVWGEAPEPAAGPGEVLVRVRAAGLNAADLHLLGADPFPVRFYAGLSRPRFLTLGADVAGVVETVGAGVTRFQPGDPVFGDLSACRWGGLAELVAAPAAALTAKPGPLSFVEAAAVPMAAVTAYQSLVTHGRLQPGESVLIHGASGGVGTCAVQIARALGARVTAVCSARNTALVQSLGAGRVIDYGAEDFAALGPQFHLIHAANGDRPLKDFARVLAPGGRFVLSGGSNRQLFQALVLGPLRTLGGRGRFGAITAVARPADLQALVPWLEQGRLRPVVDRTFPLDRGAEALAYLRDGHPRGKVVVTVSGPEA